MTATPLLGALRATPWCNSAPAAGEVQVLPPIPASERIPELVPEEARRAAKSVHIRGDELQRRGYITNCSKCEKMHVGHPSKGMAHTSACRAWGELPIAQANDPRWNGAEDRIADRLADIAAAAGPPAIAPAAATAAVAAPATPVLNAETFFDAVFAEEEPSAGPAIEWLPIDVSDEAKMDFYITDELDEWPVGPEADQMVGLMALGASPAQRRKANEIVELFVTLGADFHVARANVAELYLPPRVTAQLAKLQRIHLAPDQTFDLRQDRNGRSWNFLLEADGIEPK